MERMTKWRLWLIGSAAGLFGALLIVPPTGWIVRSHLRLGMSPLSPLALLADLGIKEIHPSGGPMAPLDRERLTAETRRLAESHPNDYSLQLSRAVNKASETQHDGAPPGDALTWRQEFVMPLLARFPDRPSAYAQALRFACMRGLLAKREENWRISGDTPPKDALPATLSDPDPRKLARYDQIAADGERLDPDNAFFPFMRAIGLLAARDDAAADRALLRAGDKTHWEDYAGDEVVGQWRVLEEVFGDHSNIAHMAYACAVLFPHYAQARGLARVETYRAIMAEAAGRRDEGLALRHALIQVSGLMRSDARSIIGALVGVAIEQMALARPGGAPASPEHNRDVGWSGDDAARERRAAYLAYLNRIERPDEVRWTERELDAADRSRDIAQRGIRTGDFVLGAVRPVVWGIASSTAFLSMVWFLVGALLATLALRSDRLRAGRPLSWAGRWGVAFGLAMAGACLVSSFWVWAAPQILVILSAIGLAGVWVGTRLWRRHDFLRNALSVGLVASAITVLAAIVLMWARGAVGFALAMTSAIFNLTNGDNIDTTRMVLPWFVLAFSPLLLVPATLLVISLVSWRCRVPLTVGLARSLRGVGVPLACLTCLGYVVLVSYQARVDMTENAALARRAQHEGRFYADMLHTEWPGKG